LHIYKKSICEFDFKPKTSIYNPLSPIIAEFILRIITEKFLLKKLANGKIGI